MVDVKKYIWSIPLLAGILGLLGIITPAVYISMFATDFYYWLWGFVIFKTYPPWVPEEYIGFTTNTTQLILLNISTILIITSAIILIVTAVIFKKNRNYSSVIENTWLICAFLSIGAAIFWIMVVESPTGGSLTPMPPGMQFWTYFSPHFGIIAPFISSGFAIGGMAAYRHFLRGEREPIVSKEKKLDI